MLLLYLSTSYPVCLSGLWPLGLARAGEGVESVFELGNLFRFGSFTLATSNTEVFGATEPQPLKSFVRYTIALYVCPLVALVTANHRLFNRKQAYNQPVARFSELH